MERKEQYGGKFYIWKFCHMHEGNVHRFLLFLLTHGMISTLHTRIRKVEVLLHLGKERKFYRGAIVHIFYMIEVCGWCDTNTNKFLHEDQRLHSHCLPTLTLLLHSSTLSHQPSSVSIYHPPSIKPWSFLLGCLDSFSSSTFSSQPSSYHCPCQSSSYDQLSSAISTDFVTSKEVSLDLFFLSHPTFLPSISLCTKKKRTPFILITAGLVVSNHVILNNLHHRLLPYLEQWVPPSAQSLTPLSCLPWHHQTPTYHR